MLKIHHLNVGHGDCIIVQFESGRNLMVDINRSSDFDDKTKEELTGIALGSIESSKRIFYECGLMTKNAVLTEAKYDIKLTDPIEYLKDNEINSLFRFVSTHPHADHFTGLNELFEAYSVENFWVSKNSFSVDKSKLSGNQLKDWDRYVSFRDSTERKVGSTTVINPRDGNSLDFWAQDGVTILAPSPALITSAEEKDNKNIMSYVLLIEYAGRKIVLGGDAEDETWEYIMDNYSNKIKDVTLLDASHHGRDTGFNERAVKHMNPAYVVVSVGKKPKTDASNKYRKYSDNVWSTRWKGNITFSFNSDGTGSYKTEYDR